MAWRRIDVHRAVERGDIAVLKRYLDAGEDVEKKDEEYGAAPVHWAALVIILLRYHTASSVCLHPLFWATAHTYLYVMI